MKLSRRQHRVVRISLATAAASFILVVVLWVVTSSFMRIDDYYSASPRVLPSRPTLENYAKVLIDSSYSRYLVNSVVVAAGVVPAQVLFASVAGYILAKRRFFGRIALVYLFLIPLMVPSIVVILPTYFLIHRIGWSDTYAALIVPFLFSGWSTFFFRQYYLGFPIELEDAASIDGASNLRFFAGVLLPTSKPAYFAISVVAFASIWREFVWPLLVNTTNDMRTVEVGIAFLSSVYQHNPAAQLAAATLSASVPILVFFFARKHVLSELRLMGSGNGSTSTP